MAIIIVVSAIIFSASVLAVPEQGKWTLQLNEDHQYAAVAKHMYKDGKVTVTVSLNCDGEPGDSDGVEISWMLRSSPCAMEFIAVTEDVNKNPQTTGERYMWSPVYYRYKVMPYDSVEIERGGSNHSCTEREFKLEGVVKRRPEVIRLPTVSENNTATEAASAASPASDSQTESKDGTVSDGSQNSPAAQPSPSNQASGSGQDNNAALRKKRDASDPQPTGTETGGGPAQPSGQDGQGQTGLGKAGQDKAVSTSAPPARKPEKLDHPIVAQTWVDANYLFIIKVKPNNEKLKFKADVTIRMFYGDDNFISAMDYPLLIFYGVIGLVYIAYGLLWLVFLACNWRDLLRVQFWIGGVILLGMLEKAVFFAEYENINKTGVSVRGAVIFAELVSCLKRTLARMLVIIVSLGFGIVKPRLGQAFHKVLFVGGLFFILAAIEGSMRATSSKADQSNQFLLAAVPLAVLDAIICWWIFASLLQTTRTLRLRRNVVKLTLYRHFTNTLIFAVLASLAYMIWSMTQHKFKDCVKDWKELWVDEAFWHLLFVVLLLIIMLLWRPTANNQRYAFSPLLDAAEEEDEDDAVMNDAFDGMKMRGVKAANGSPKQRDPKSKMEDDLKWVEENIPSSVADKAMPLLDSDEELMTTKFEMSKME